MYTICIIHSAEFVNTCRILSKKIPPTHCRPGAVFIRGLACFHVEASHHVGVTVLGAVGVGISVNVVLHVFRKRLAGDHFQVDVLGIAVGTYVEDAGVGLVCQHLDHLARALEGLVIAGVAAQRLVIHRPGLFNVIVVGGRVVDGVGEGRGIIALFGNDHDLVFTKGGQFCGEGEGKSSAAFGKGLIEASKGKNVIIIKFMKNKDENEMEYFSRLEPEIKLFRFERTEIGFCDLTEEQKIEESMNIKNGINYANKVLSTGECDVLVLDEILGVLDEGIISNDEVRNILESKSEEMSIIMTGRNLPDELRVCVDIVSKISNET